MRGLVQRPNPVCPQCGADYFDCKCGNIVEKANPFPWIPEGRCIGPKDNGWPEIAPEYDLKGALDRAELFDQLAEAEKQDHTNAATPESIEKEMEDSKRTALQKEKLMSSLFLNHFPAMKEANQ